MAELMEDYRQEDPYVLTEEQLNSLNSQYQIFREITQEFPVSLGKEISKDERDKGNMTQSTLTYGEVDFISLGEIFYTIRERYGGIPSGGVFYDLGHGTGKGVLAAALLHNFDSVRGIEILQGLHDISTKLADKYREVMQNVVPDGNYPQMEVINQSFFEYDWSDATFIFANSTCFNMSMMDQIANSPVQPGTFAITLTKHFPGANWKIHESIRKRMSWGEATVYIQQRKTPEEAQSSIPNEIEDDYFD